MDGHHCGQGKSGEFGCYQFLPDTWVAFATETIGYVPRQSRVNEDYVAAAKIQGWLDQGKSVEQIALLWNQGNTKPCSSGVNKHGVKYDSCAYVRIVLAYYHQ